MAHPGIAAGHRRSRLAGPASLAIHGGLLLVVIAHGRRAAHTPRHDMALTAIEVVQAPSPPLMAPPPSMAAPPATPVARPAGPSAKPDGRARRQAARAQPGAASARSSLPDLMVSYDHPTNFASNAAATLDEPGDAGRSGIGSGVDRRFGDDVASLQLPEPPRPAPPAVSLARAPRPRFDYSKLRLPGASKFAGRMIKVVLDVDARGRVRDVQLLQGVDRDLDRRMVALVYHFEFEPALDERGAATSGTSRWNLEIVEDEDDDPFPTARGRGRL